jgi:general secretion pathway protein L
MFGSIGRAFLWFVDGLVDAWIAMANSLWRRQRIALIHAGDGYAIEQNGGQPGKETLRLETGDNGSYFAPRELAAKLQSRDIDFILSPDEVLIRSLDPLPGESRQYLDSIVHHQLERVAPWRADDVLHTYRVAPAERGNDRVLVTVIATARSLHAQLLEALQALRPREIRLVCRGQRADDEAVAIPVDNGAAAAARRIRLRRLVAAAVSLLLLAIVSGASLMGWTWYTTDTELTVVADNVAAQRKRLIAARREAPTTDQDLKSMVQRRWTTPYTVLALNALAKALPDNTWLSEVRVAEGRIRMVGISKDVPGLVPLIEASSAFAGATFYAPTARLPADQGDRFHLEARLLPVEKPKP